VDSNLINAICDLINREGIIEILGGERVNSEDALLPQVSSQLNFFLRYFPLSRDRIKVLGEDPERLMDLLIEFLSLCHLILIRPDVVGLQDPQALSIQVTSLTNVLDNAANRSDVPNIPAFKLGNIVPVLRLPLILKVINELRRDVSKRHPWQLFADRNSKDATVHGDL
jgi:hypothetical protein